MDNRFGLKDFVLMVLIVALIGMIWLAMLQFDRQWQVIQQTNQQIMQQTGDLARIRQLLERGAYSGPTTGPSSRPALAGFERILHSQEQANYAQGDMVVDTFGVVPDKLTPLISTDLYSSTVQSYVLDTLVDRDPNTFKYIPRLATSWSISDDQLSITFNLRHDVTFSDGTPLTADDVIFTLDLERNEKIEAPRLRAYLDKLKSVDKIDDYTVRFVFSEPYFKSFETAGTTQVMEKAFYSKYSPTEFNRSTGLLIGSGPYRLADPTSWKPEPGKPVELIRNERYWGPTPSFNKLVWKIIENPSARATTFRNGDTDIYGPDPNQYDQMVSDASLVSRTNHYAMDVPNSGYRYIGWNEKQGRDGAPSLFADKRVRQALTMLTDREGICKNILRGYASVISGPFSPLTPQSDPTIHPLPYDPDAAIKLLAEAGFTKRGDQLFSPDGKPFTFSLMYPTTSDPIKRIVSYIHDSYARAGILVEAKPTEWTVLLKRLDDRDYQAVILGWTGSIEGDPHQIFDSSQIAGTGDNFIQYSDPALDAAMNRARATVDENKRMPIWHEVHRIIAEDQPYTFLFISKDLEFTSNRFRGVEITKLGLNPLLEWYVPTALQKYKN